MEVVVVDQPECHGAIAADCFSSGSLNAVLNRFTRPTDSGVRKPLLHRGQGGHQQKAKNDQGNGHFNHREAVGPAWGGQHVDPFVSQQRALTVAPLNFVVVRLPS